MPQGAGAAAGASGRQIHASFARDKVLRCEVEAQKKKGSVSAARLGVYRHARGVGEFFDLYPGPLRVARNDLD